MKNVLLPLILLLGISLLTTSCKDDEEEQRANELQINGTTELVTNAFIEEYGDNGNESYDWDVTLTTDSLDISTYNGGGSGLYLDLNSNSAEGLVSGTYNWSDVREAFTIVDASAIVNYDATTETYDFVLEATSGNVVVNVGDNETEFDVTLTMEDGSAVTAYYKGELTPF